MRRTAPHCGQRQAICSSTHTPTAYPAIVRAIATHGFFSAPSPKRCSRCREYKPPAYLLPYRQLNGTTIRTYRIHGSPFFNLSLPFYAVAFAAVPVRAF